MNDIVRGSWEWWQDMTRKITRQSCSTRHMSVLTDAQLADLARRLLAVSGMVVREWNRRESLVLDRGKVVK